MKKPRIEDIAGILHKYAKPRIRKKEVAIAWKSFAKEQLKKLKTLAPP